LTPRIKELEATKQVLLTPEFEISDAEAERILNMDIEIEDLTPQSIEETIFPVVDTEENLYRIAKKAINGVLEHRPIVLLRALSESREHFLDSSGETQWVLAADIDNLFPLSKYDNHSESKGHLAWYLSQPPTSSYYSGEWFSRKGKFIIRNVAGKEDIRFKTSHYMLRKEAFKALDFLRDQWT